MPKMSGNLSPDEKNGQRQNSNRGGMASEENEE